MYENWITFNPLNGSCSHKCPYCSTNKFFYPEQIKCYTGELRLNENAMKKPLGKNNNIFVVAQNDLFAENVPTNFISEIINYCKKFDNTYLFQTKNPEKLFNFIPFLPEKSIICTTIESNIFYYDFMGNTPTPHERAKYMSRIFGIEKHVTIEPIMKFDLVPFAEMLKLINPFQINIGANSFTKIKLPEPSKDEILALISELVKFTKVVKKTNLKRLF